MSLLAALVLWLGMYGQAHDSHQQKWKLVDGCWITYNDAADTLPGIPCSRPPAEYVFEIRTKRERVSDCNGAYIDAEGCVRLTRELWMDGKRLGIIKGLD